MEFREDLFFSIPEYKGDGKGLLTLGDLKPLH